MMEEGEQTDPGRDAFYGGFSRNVRRCFGKNKQNKLTFAQFKARLLNKCPDLETTWDGRHAAAADVTTNRNP